MRAGSAAGLGAIVTTAFVLTLALASGFTGTLTSTLVFETRAVLAGGHPPECLTYAGRLNCLSYTLSIHGASGDFRRIDLSASLNASCPTTCYAELQSRAPNSTASLHLGLVDAPESASGIFPAGPAYLLLVEAWGCAAFAPCEPPPVTMTITVTDTGSADP
jgi:hypothetical protein